MISFDQFFKTNLIVGIILALCCYNAFGQLESDEVSNPEVVSLGDLHYAKYDKCRGVLDVVIPTSFDANNTKPIYKAYVYLKIGSEWKNMLTIRGEDARCCNNTCGAAMRNSTGTNGIMDPAYNSIVNAGNHNNTCPAGTNVNNPSGIVETGHVKRRIGYYNGASNNFSWFSYEDELLCESYNSNLDKTGNGIHFVKTTSPPHLQSGHSSGIGNDLKEISVYPTNITAWGLQFAIRNVPFAAIQSNSIQMRVYVNYRTYEGHWGDPASTHNSHQVYFYSVSTQIPDAPYGLTATTNQCGKVNLNWSNPSQTWAGSLNCTNSQKYNIVVYRDGQKIAILPPDATSFSDNFSGLVPRQDYKYTLQTVVWNEGNTGFRLSSVSNQATGTLKTPPAQPSPLSATDENCDGSIEFTWSQPSGTASHKYRYTITNTATNQIVSGQNNVELDGSLRSKKISGLNRGVEHLIKLVARNDCGYASDTASVIGISPSDPAVATNLKDSIVPSGDSLILTWSDNANNESKYQIVRQDNLGNVVLYDENADATVFIDNGLIGCRTFTYKVKAINSCVQSGVQSVGVQTDTIAPPNLNTTFSTSKKLDASKGYFANRVELSWTNNNGNNVDLFKIYRKLLGNSADSTLITTVNAGSELFLDQTADAKVLYKYTIVGVKNCAGKELLTNTSEAIGFRNPTGIVSGHIEYEGAVAVEGARVLVEPSNGTQGKSLSFVSGDSAVCEGDKSILSGQDLRIEFWFKPSSYNDQVIVSKKNTFWFENVANGFRIRVNTGSGTTSTSINEGDINLNNWHHLAAQYVASTGELKIYLDGLLKSSTNLPASQLSIDVNEPIIIGGQGTFKIDELRLFSQATADSIVKRDHSRFLNQDKEGTLISLRMDEAYGSYAYDGSSQNSLFNKNHFKFTSGISFDSDRPTSAQLGYVGITDSLGNYLVSGIVYSGTGDNYTLTPSYLTHSFSPATKTLFIGENGRVYNNQDFIDNSSFKVTGTLLYSNTTCAVPGASVKIDGLSVIQNGLPVVTDDNGQFEINVPIGNHFVSVEKFKHDMEAGRFPANGTYNFQAPVSSIQFTDSTTRILVGRVVGGQVEAEKVPGMGRSKNNIGQAKIRLISPIAGPGCFSIDFNTDSLTGEFRVAVPPLEYRVDSLYIISNKNVLGKHINADLFTNAKKTIDLRNAVSETTERDSVFNSTGTFTGQIDSAIFNNERNFVYRTTPTIDVQDTLGRVFIGEDSISVENQFISIRPTGVQKWGPFTWPVFRQDKKYTFQVLGAEIYTNADNPSQVRKDTVLLDGNVKITNGLIRGSDPNPVVDMINGKARYSFTAGEPNNSTNSTNSNLSYTWNLQVKLEPSGAPAVVWEPNTTLTPGNPNYHAYIIGQKITGTGISTQGPETVDFILRDPPGSESSATWTQGSTVTVSNNYSVGFSEEHNSVLNIHLGKKAATGAIAYYENIEVENTQSVGFQSSYQKNTTNGYTESFSSSTSVSTRDDDGNVGAPADIFVGRSRNWLVGPTSNIELRDASKCVTGVECFGPVVDGKRLAKTVGYTIAPDGVRTRFAYTAKEIEENVIPQLESLRKNFFVNQPTKYISHIPESDTRYGSNNDDPHWNTDTSSSTPLIYDKRDTTGSSYTVYGLINYDYDSVRILNNQIRLWKETLALNEKEKYEAVNNQAGYTLVDNFTLGSAIISNSYSVERENIVTTTFELALGGNANSVFGGIFGGIGVSGEISLSLSKTSGGEESRASTSSNSFEYTFTDGDPGDIMSVDVYKSDAGVGHIFVTRGGQTMCPYEDAVKLHYYNPNKPNGFISSHTYNEIGYSTIANATVKREEPNIQITPAQQFNVPSDQAAVYQLQLTNQSALTVNNDIDLRVFVASESNPNGAIVKIDGLDPNTTYTIPTGASVVKTLTVERGPIEIEYDSLMIVFASKCSDDIADTAYISAHFIPSCTEITMSQPPQNWVFNNAISNQANLIANNYNYNYGAATDTSTNPPTKLGFNNIAFEFKPSNTSSWTNFQTFYKYPDAGQDTIPNGQVFTQYSWDIKDLPDGTYDLKAISNCLNKDGSFAFKETEIKSGIIDRINPHPFGTPTPGDGILDPNDDISIQFNEAIDGGSLSLSNFDIRGVVNGIESNQNTSMYFDGLDDYLKIAEGINLQRRNFTLEFWAKKDASGAGEQAVFYQGVDPKSDVWFGFDANNKLKFELGDASVSTDQAVTNVDQWHHYAVVYDFANQVADLFVDGTNSNTNKSILHNYQGSGRIYIGKNAEANTHYFKGNISDVRIWNLKRSNGEIVANFNKQMNRNASGLLHNWKLDEAHGTFPKDDIRGKEAQAVGTTWQVTPGGSSIEFNGNNQDVEITTGTVAITDEMDFTLEFWFKSNQSGAATLVSNGKGDGLGADSLYSWNIDKDASGKIFVRHRGLNFEAVSQDVFDDKWHHFALIMQRTGNLSAYIDGNLQNTVEADDFHSFSGTKMTLGARGYYVGSTLTKEAFFDGHIDEFRMWNSSRKLEQIRRDMRNRLKGDEPGLQVFVPGESYTIQMNVPILTSSFNDFSPNTLSTTNNSAVLSSETPTLKLPRPVQAINFVYSLNNDKIIITPTDAPELIENVTLDITVKNVKDKQGNTMQSPKTWIAYMNKNQVKWSDDYFAFEKALDSNLQFTTQVINTGGAATSFTISNIPSWLSASATSGTIAPDASQTITFTISDGVNIGDFTQDIFLTTDFNFPEKLTIDLTVRKKAPDWNVNPSDYQFSMSIFGQLKMDDIISANEEDQLVAFINGEVRGKATLQYVSQYDHYVAYLNIYSNSTNSDSIEFKMWNAMKGEIYVDVVPELVFTENDIVGTPGQPQLFTGTNRILKLIPAAAGWSWVSFPLNSEQFTSTDALFSEVTVTDGDVIKGLFAYDQYDQTAGWIGGISSNGGFDAASTYKVSLASADTIELLGEVAHPDSVNIVINPGWNWIGFVSPKNLDIQTAMSNYNAQDGDVLKSQFHFAYYDSQIGWVGSLSHLKSGQGYMLKASAIDTFNFPISSLYGPSAIIPNDNVEALEMQLAKTDFEQNMSVVAKTNICNEWLDQGSIILGAFNKQNQLRGYATPTWSELDNEYRFYLTAYNGFENESLNFVFYDSITGDFMSTSSEVEFVSNTVIGSTSTPIEVNIDEEYSCAGTSLGLPILTNANQYVNVAPNPFEKKLTIYSGGLPENAEYELLDSYGKVVRTGKINSAGETTLTEPMLSAGVYFIRVMGSSFNKQIKVIKL